MSEEFKSHRMTEASSQPVPRSARLSIALGLIGGYTVWFFAAYPDLGPGVAAAGLLPALGMSWFLGIKEGVATAIGLFFLNTLFFNLVEEPGGWLVVFHAGGGPGSFIIILIAWATGWVRNLRSRLVSQLAALKQSQRDLEWAKHEAQQANRAKSEFLANVSHEIRTPISGILGITELVLATPLTAEQRENLQLVKWSGDALLAVINDILDISSIEAGKFKLQPVPFSLQALLDATLRPIQVRANAKHLELTHEVRSDVPDGVVGDPDRLRQIITNLVSNAVKFTAKGQVQVSVEPARRTSPTPSAVGLLIRVSDTGIGIPLDRQQAIFEAFEQVDNSVSRSYEGTGLGLSIASQLVTQMNGQIGVRSELQKGSTFYFTVWLRRASEKEMLQLQTNQPPADYTGVDSRKLQILVVEDNEINQRVATLLLEKRGHTVTTASNGREAMDTLGQQYYDVVLLDIQLPEMDGFRIAELIRQKEKEPGQRQSIIAVTAHAMAGDRDRFLESGMDGYLSKPYTAQDLYKAIDKVTARES